MQETVHNMKLHGQFIRHNGGFWSWLDVEVEIHKNGSQEFIIPVWWCDVKTLRALAKRNIVRLDEEKKIKFVNSTNLCSLLNI